MEISELRDFLRQDLQRVEALIARSLGSDIALLDATNGMILAHGGKRLRPMLALLTGGACGTVNGDTVRFAAASELLHNATLLHDDVVDGAGERRGVPTVMSVLNGPASVLIGDFWLVRAMDNILAASRSGERVIRIFAKTLSDLAEGELLQMQKASSADTTQEDYLRIIYSKTGSLFEASALSAAISVDAPAEVEEAVSAYARNLGVAFQIRDDMFDYMDGAAVGKPVGIDLQEQKITQPLLCALEAAPSEAPAIREKVARIHGNPAYADEVRAFVKAHGGIAGAAEKQDFYIDRAISCLRTLPESEEKSYLAKLARFVGERTL